MSPGLTRVSVKGSSLLIGSSAFCKNSNPLRLNSDLLMFKITFFASDLLRLPLFRSFCTLLTMFLRDSSIPVFFSSFSQLEGGFLSCWPRQSNEVSSGFGLKFRDRFELYREMRDFAMNDKSSLKLSQQVRYFLDLVIGLSSS